MSQYLEGVESYASLKMGPIIAHPEVKACFNLPSNPTSVCKVIEIPAVVPVPCATCLLQPSMHLIDYKCFMLCMQSTGVS